MDGTLHDVSIGAGSMAALLAAGAVAGFFNVTAGGGSMLTLPVLVLAGLPPTVANGTNRLALIVQNLVAVPTFRRGGVRGLRTAVPLALCGLPGALVGAYLGATMSDVLFRKLLGVTILVMTAVIVLRPPSARGDEIPDGSTRLATKIAFFGLGFYAGFIQAGIGFLIVIALSAFERFPLVKIHALKIAFVLVMQVGALVVFAAHGKVALVPGAILAAGLAIGGYAGALVTLRGDERLLRAILVAASLALAIRMFFP